ncbi:hypothetical protein ACHWQZ_G004474 [Mnemiopsis leidyi]
MIAACCALAQSILPFLVVDGSLCFAGIRSVELVDADVEVDENGLLVDELDEVGEDVIVVSIDEDVDDGLLVEELDDEDGEREDEEDAILVEDVEVIVEVVEEELVSSVGEDVELDEDELSVDGVVVNVDVDGVDEVDEVELVVDVELDETPTE